MTRQMPALRGGMAMLWCALVAGGCERSEPEEPVATGRHALRFESTDRDRFILAHQQPTAVELAVIERGGELGYGWSQLDIPKGKTGRMDMADPEADILFTQNYRTECSRTEVSRPCWVKERYRSGDPGLIGHVQVVPDPASGRVRAAYAIYWEGMTDRFGLPEIWYSHGSESGGYFGATPILRSSP